MDVLTRIIVPSGAPETWLGSELVTPVANPAGGTAGTVNVNDLVLDTTTDNCGTPPNAGQVWAVGRHKVSFDITNGSTYAGGSPLVYRVRNITDSNDAVALTVSNGYALGERRTTVLEFDSVAGKSYQPQLDDPLIAGFRVHAITHEFIPYLAQNEQAHTEPDNGIVHKRDSAGNLLGVLGTEGTVPLMVPPGLTAIFIIPLDVPKAGYTEPESVKARTVSVTATGSPRYLG
jgi:hypothetical protein